MTFVVVVTAIKVWLNVVSTFGAPVESPSGVAVAETNKKDKPCSTFGAPVELFKQKLVT